MAPRDPESLKIQPWADSGDRTDPDDNSLAVTLDRDDGWTLPFEQSGGNTPRRRVFNQIEREKTGMLHEINQHGLLEWDDEIDYVHPARVIGSDNREYVSIQNSTNENPTTDTSRTYWKPLIDSPDGTINPSNFAQATGTFAFVEYLTPSQVSFSNNVITLSPSIAVTSLAQGKCYGFFVEQAPTGGVTIRVSALPARSLRFAGTQVGNGGLHNGSFIVVVYDGSNFQLLAMQLNDSVLYRVGTAQGRLALLGTGGRWSASQIPDLAASKITSGKFPYARLPIVVATTDPVDNQWEDGDIWFRRAT